MKIISFSSMLMLVFGIFTAAAFAQDQDERLNKFEESLKSQQQTIEQQQKTIDTLKTQVTQNQSPSTAAPVSPSQKASGLFGGSAFTNPNLSIVLDAFGYSSNLTNDELANRGIPRFHDAGVGPATGVQRRFSRAVLLFPVDPYLNFYANLPVTDDGIEIEEAYCRDHGPSRGLADQGRQVQKQLQQTRFAASSCLGFLGHRVALPGVSGS